MRPPEHPLPNPQEGHEPIPLPPVHDFREKFQEGFTGWKPGMRIRSKFFVEKKRQPDGSVEFELLVSDHSVVGDVRNADMFRLQGVAPEQLNQLTQAGMAEVEATVTVTTQGTYEVSNMFRYGAHIEPEIVIQEPWDGDESKLEKNKSVLVQGEVVDYHSEGREPERGSSFITIRLKSGKDVKVEMWNGYIEIDDGTLEILSPSYPIAGDIVQVNAIYGNPDIRYRRNLPDRLTAFWCRSTYLLEPEKTRVEAFETQRNYVKDSLRSLIVQTDLDTFRAGYGELLTQSIIQPSQGVFRWNLTVEETHTLQELVKNKFPEEQTMDAPLELLDELYHAEHVRKNFGVDIYAMSKAEFYLFALQVARNEWEYPEGGEVNLSDIYLLAGDNLPEFMQEEIATAAVNTFYPMAVGKEPVFKKAFSVNPATGEKEYSPLFSVDTKGFPEEYDPEELANPRSVAWHIRSAVEHSLGELGRFVNPKISQLLLVLLSNIDKQSLFKRGEERDRREYFEHKIFEVLEENVAANVQVRADETGAFRITVDNPEALSPYLHALPGLVQFAKRIQQEAWTNQGMIDPIKELRKTIALLTLAAASSDMPEQGQLPNLFMPDGPVLPEPKVQEAETSQEEQEEIIRTYLDHFTNGFSEREVEAVYRGIQSGLHIVDTEIYELEQFALETKRIVPPALGILRGFAHIRDTEEGEAYLQMLRRQHGDTFAEVLEMMIRTELAAAVRIMHNEYLAENQ